MLKKVKKLVFQVEENIIVWQSLEMLYIVLFMVDLYSLGCGLTNLLLEIWPTLKILRNPRWCPRWPPFHVFGYNLLNI